MFLGSKQRTVEALIGQYLDQVTACVDAFVACIESSFDAEPFESLIEKVERTHQAESQADDVRREIGLLLYGKALFPESRGDILGLLEVVDKIPNRAETVVRQMQHQRFYIPTELGPQFKSLVAKVRECSLEVIKAVRTLFSDYHRALFFSDRVSEIESRADDLEFQLIEAIFSSNRETGDKILLRDMVQAIGSIADQAENAADRVRIVAIKRKI